MEAQGYLSVFSFNKEQNSKPRNPFLADARFKSGYIDARGRGTLKIIEACKEAGLPSRTLKKPMVVLLSHFTCEKMTLLRERFGMISEKLRDKLSGQIAKYFLYLIYNCPLP